MRKFLSILLLFPLVTSCGRFNNKEDGDKKDQRIVCISKQYSEIIYAIGAEKNIVAVDISSTYPPEIKKLPTIGYHRALSVEAVLAAKPDLILHDNTIGPEHVVRQLEELKIPMKTFVKGETIDSTKMLIREMGTHFHKEAAADSLCTKLDSEMGMALEKAKQYKDTPRVLIVHFGSATNSWLLMTKRSTAGKMINWAGGQMAIDDKKGMRQMSAEVVAASDPDVILLTDKSYDRLGSKDKILELPGIAGTKAAKNNRIYRVEQHDFIYLGPRTGENVLKLEQLIHQGDSTAKK